MRGEIIQAMFTLVKNIPLIFPVLLSEETFSKNKSIINPIIAIAARLVMKKNMRRAGDFRKARAAIDKNSNKINAIAVRCPPNFLRIEGTAKKQSIVAIDPTL